MTKKQEMAKKMKNSIHKAEIRGKKKHYERVMGDFNREGLKKHNEKMWEYARENRMSDKRLF